MTPQSPARASILAPDVLRRLGLAYLPILALLALLVAGLHWRDLQREREVATGRAQTLVQHQAQRLSRDLEAARADLLYLASREDLRAVLSGSADQPSVAADLARLVEVTRSYDQVRLLDASGQELLRVERQGDTAQVAPDDDLQSKAARYYFQETRALPAGEVFTSRFDLNVEHGTIQEPWQPVFRVATPVTSPQGELSGVLVLNRRGDEILSRLQLPGPASAQVTLVDASGYYLEAPVPQRSWGFQLGLPATFASEHPGVWAAMQVHPARTVELDGGLLTWRHLGQAPGQRAASPNELSLTVVASTPQTVLVARPRAVLRRLALLAVLAALLLLALTWAVAASAVERERQGAALAASTRRLRSLSERLMATTERERKKLSRELHDGVGQLVTAVNLAVQRARRATTDPDRDALLVQAEEGTIALRQGLHDLATALRPSVLDDVGLEQAARVHLDAWERTTGICPHLEADLGGAVLSPSTRENAFRVLQEALGNVARHAGVDEVWVELVADHQALVLVVRDRGTGFAPQAVRPERLGLVGMRERAQLMGGTFHVSAAPGEGTEVVVRLPLVGTVS